MKVTLSLDNNAQLTVEVSEGVGRKMFGALVEEMFKEKYGVTEVTRTITHEQPVEQIKISATLSEPKSIVKEDERITKFNKREVLNDGTVVSVTTGNSGESNMIKGYDPTVMKPRRLIFYHCSACKQTQYHLGFEGDTAYCRNCNTPHEVGQTMFGQYQCPNCEQTATFRVEGDKVTTVKCKSCESDIDMTVHPGGGKWVSMNLLRY